MPSPRLRSLSAALVLLSVVACDATGPANVPRVVVGTPSHVAPGGYLAVFITAVPPSGGTIDRVLLEVAGLTTFADSIREVSPGTVVLTRSIKIPDEPAGGQLIVTASLWSGSVVVRDTAHVTVADTAPPRFGQFIVGPGQTLNPGDVLSVTYSVSDEAGLRATVLRLSGAMTVTDSVPHGLARDVIRTAKIPIPREVHLDTNVAIVVEAIDAGRNRTVRTVTSLAVRDTRLPVLSGLISGSRVGTRFSPGDTVRLTLSASDNHFLEQLAYTVGSPSVAADTFDIRGSSSFNRILEFVVDESWIGIHAISGWVRDASGNVTSATFGTISVLNAAPPPDSVSVGAPVRDLVYDARRNIVYLSQPSAGRVGAVTLGDMIFDSVLEGLPSPQGIDVTPSGDTLLIAPRLSRALYVYDLARRTRDSVQITDDPHSWNRGLDNVRAMANGLALISVTFSGSGFGGSLASLDLATRTVRNRATVTEATPIARSMSRSRAAVLIDDSCCPLSARVYDATTDQLSNERPTVDYYFPPVSADSTGDRYLIGSTLFTGDLAPIRSYTIPNRFASFTSAISPNGAYGYFATETGVTMLRLSDGAVVTAFPLTSRPSKLLALPDGRALIAIVGQTMHVIWLP